MSSNISATFTREGRCSNSGVHAPDGSVFIGSHDKDKWRDKSAKHHHKIIEARNNGEAGCIQKKGSNKRKVLNAVKRKKQKLEKLKAQIAAAKSQVKKVTFAADSSSDSDTPDNQAGDAFGGKKSKRKLKHNE